ncbi:unnamed protein product [Parnassius mnemosyne]|uniref:Uncharacterized protein n=1 Tax=Parnassius mnemosyne TaxID=213953 RepID=A0AAV1KHR1_9NEOP
MHDVTWLDIIRYAHAQSMSQKAILSSDATERILQSSLLIRVYLHRVDHIRHVATNSAARCAHVSLARWALHQLVGRNVLLIKIALSLLPASVVPVSILAWVRVVSTLVAVYKIINQFVPATKVTQEIHLLAAIKSKSQKKYLAILATRHLVDLMPFVEKIMVSVHVLV